MASKSKTPNLLLWILVFIGLGIFLVYMLLNRLPEGNRTFLNVIGVFGAYVSLFSLVLMFSQFKSIRVISQETKDKIDTILSVSDLAKHVELARNVQDDVNSGKYDLAIYKIQIIKETLIKLEKSDDTDNDTISEYCGKLGTHITNLRSGNSRLRRKVISGDLEDIADFLLRQEEKLKNKTN